MKKVFQFILFTALVAAPCFSIPTSVIAQETEEKAESKQEEEQEEELSVQERMQEAMMLFQDEEFDEALEMVEAIYSDNPEDERVGLTLVQVQQQIGSMMSQEERVKGNKYYYASGKTARKVMKDPDVPEPALGLIAQAIYNEACCYGVDGETEKAMKSLEEAFELGFSEFELAETDSDFGDMLETDEYQDLLEKYRGIAEEKEKQAKMRELEELKTEIADFESFDFDFNTDNMDGDEITLSQYSGKMVIVDFWGTWCPPCRAEIPHYIELKKKYADQLEIVGLAYERGADEDAIDKVVEFMEDNDINYECALGDEDTRDLVPDFRGYPTTLFIDGEGKVRYMKVGASDYDKLETIVKVILED